MRHKILIVDDEADIVNMLKEYFEFGGYDVITAYGGTEAVEKSALNPDIILLDINMPDIDGLEVCRRIREFVSCPIVFLTARIEDNDKIRGFATGGDDYVVKPFSIHELGARIDAHLRRENRQKSQSKVKFDGNLTIDYSERCVYYNNLAVSFAKKEFDIIELLSQNKGQIFDKERIYESVWGWDSEGDSSVVAEHVRRIRAKFASLQTDTPKANSYIETVWGVGYKWAK